MWKFLLLSHRRLTEMETKWLGAKMFSSAVMFRTTEWVLALYLFCILKHTWSTLFSSPRVQRVWTWNKNVGWKGKLQRMPRRHIDSSTGKGMPLYLVGDRNHNFPAKAKLTKGYTWGSRVDVTQLKNTCYELRVTSQQQQVTLNMQFVAKHSVCNRCCQFVFFISPGLIPKLF